MKTLNIILMVFGLLMLMAFVEEVFKNSRRRDYQIEVNQDEVKVYDGTRLVGTLPWDESPLDSLILRDNQ